MNRPLSTFVGNLRGFTLVEVLLSLGITSFLLLVTVSLGVDLSRSRFDMINKGSLAQDALLLSSYFTSHLQAIGGGSVRPWMSVWVENNTCAARGVFPACNGSDRLTTVTTTSNYACTVLSQVSSDTLEFQVNAGVCCLSTATANTPAMLTLGSSYAQIRLETIDLGACRATYSAGQAAGNNSLPAVANWGTGVMTSVSISTFFLDTATHQLQRFVDGNDNGTAEPGELSTLVDQIYDLQVAIGYDRDLNGRLVDDGSGADEWLYNSLPVENPDDMTDAIISSRWDRMRMIQVGIATGTANGRPDVTPVSVQIFDGASVAVPGWELIASTCKARPRNALLF